MSKEIPKKIIDVTGVELTPGERTVCLGNGEQGFECCCDECDYLLLCYPEYDAEIIYGKIVGGKMAVDLPAKSADDIEHT